MLMQFLKIILLVGVQSLPSSLAIGLGQPYVPTSDDEILVKLPVNFSKLAATLTSSQPTRSLSEYETANLIQEYLEIASIDGDERYLGYARTLTAKYEMESIQTVELRLAVASLLQREHKFEQALAHLDKVLLVFPDHSEAHLMSAYINIAQGKYRQALLHCEQTRKTFGPVLALNCSAMVNALLGAADESYQQLNTLFNHIVLGGIEKRESLISLAEISNIRGDYQSAQTFLVEALEDAPGNPFLMTRLADTYLENGKYGSCIELLGGTDNPSLMLRLAIAQKNLRGEVDTKLLNFLSEYFKVQRYRNPEFASRDYAEYLLTIDDNPMAALSAALANWQTQREPADTALVLRASIAAKEKKKVDATIEWIHSAGIKDFAIDRLLTQMELMR